MSLKAETGDADLDDDDVNLVSVFAELTKRNALAAESLLAVMRDPVDVFESVREHCAIGLGELERSVTIQLSDKFLGRAGKSPIYVDLVHPDKGGDLAIDFLGSVGVERVSHDEHTAVASLLILYRLDTIDRQASFLTTDAEEGYGEAIFDAMWDLPTIPYLSPTRAREVFERHFDVKRRQLLRANVDVGVSIPQDLIEGLFELCRRLAGKYLVLVKISPKALEHNRFSYLYSHEISEYRLRRRVQGKLGQQIEIEKPGRMRHIKYASAPAAFRVHVPWVKRTNHYSFDLQAPTGFFVWRLVLLEKDPDRGLRSWRADEGTDPRWSLDSADGRRAMAFVANGRASRVPVYLGIRQEELPGRTVARAFRLAWLVLMVLALFSAGALLTTGGDLAGVAGLMLAIMAFGAFAAAAPPGPGVVGNPLLSRFAPTALAFASVWAALWLGSRQLQWNAFPTNLTWLEPARDVLWSAWLSFGWTIPIGLSLALAAVLTSRRRKQISLYYKALRSKATLSDNFFEGD